jgi:hypothetical protein
MDSITVLILWLVGGRGVGFVPFISRALPRAAVVDASMRQD